ncbi:MAG: MFS transporter [Dehalococcoidia bacterium]
MIARLYPRLYEGWIVVWSFALLIVVIGTTFFFGFGTIFTPIIQDFGWTNAEVSLAFSLRSEVGGIAAPLVGLLIDRFGPRRALFAGVLVSAGGVFGLSFMQNLWQFYLAMVVTAVGVSASGGPVGMVAAATWFDRKRSQAISYLTVGGGIAGLGVPIVAWLVETLGWRSSLRVLSLVILLVGLFVTLNVRGRPANHPQPMDGDAADSPRGLAKARELWGVPARAVMRSRAFLLLAGGQAAVGFGTTALIVHVIPFLELHGVSKGAASWIVTVYTLTSLVGRLGLGYLGDRYDKRILMTAACALVALGTPMLALTTSYWATLAVMVLIAPGFGGTIPIRPAILADYFGTRYFGAINGGMVLVQTAGAFFGPWLVGYIVDVTGEYTLGWLACGAVTALAVPLTWFARPPQRLLERYAGELEVEATPAPV